MQQLTENFIYYGETGKLLMVGPLKVIPQYQPDPNLRSLWNGMDRGRADARQHRAPDVSTDAWPSNHSARGAVGGVVWPCTGADPPTDRNGNSGAWRRPSPNVLRTPPDDWVSKLMPPGATINSVAAKYGLNPETLMRVNCLQPGDTPDRIFVPLRSVAPWTQATPLPALPPPTEGQQPVHASNGNACANFAAYVGARQHSNTCACRADSNSE